MMPELTAMLVSNCCASIEKKEPTALLEASVMELHINRDPAPHMQTIHELFDEKMQR